MLKKCGYFTYALLGILGAVDGWAAEFYRCSRGRQPPLFFAKDVCQLVADPTTPSYLPPIPKSTTAQSTDQSTDQSTKIPPSSRLNPLGSWRVTQILVPTVISDKMPDKSGWSKQAVINNVRVGIGDQVGHGRVQEISHNYVVMVHEGGETLIPFGQKRVAYATHKPIAQVALPELAMQFSYVQQQLEQGEKVLLLHQGKPLAWLKPVPSMEKPVAKQR